MFVSTKPECFDDEIADLDMPDCDACNQPVSKRSQEELLKMCEYANHMYYKPTAKIKAPERIEKLAKPKRLYMINNYDEKKCFFRRSGRDPRVKLTTDLLKAVAPEDIECDIARQKHKESIDERIKRKQERLYHEVLAKLDKQCQDQFMNAFIKKFANAVANRALSKTQPLLQTENHRKLQRSMLCNVLMSASNPKTPELRYDSCEYELYTKVSFVFADLIMSALFMAHEPGDYAAAPKPTERPEEDNEDDRFMKERALRAAKKKALERRSLVEGCRF